MVGSNGSNIDKFNIVKGMGLVREVYTDFKCIHDKFKDSTVIIGHNRYSTAGLKDAINCIQPFVVHTVAGLVAVAHNGELVNKELLRKQEIYDLMKGDLNTISYSLLVMTADKIYAIRDPWGNRPLTLGVINSKTNPSQPSHYLVASETNAFQPMLATTVRDVLPGEIVELSSAGIVSRHRLTPQTPSFCIFEYVYFSSPVTRFECDADFKGQQVYEVRKRCGRQLAIEDTNISADIVSTVPDSATPAAMGFALQAGVPYGEVLKKNATALRSFIQPNTSSRRDAIRRKFGVLDDVVAGKRVILVDDSIVRGNTMEPIVKLLRHHGAKEPNTSSRRDAIRRKFDVLDDVVAGKCVILVDDSIVRGNNTMEPIVKLLRHHGAKELACRTTVLKKNATALLSFIQPNTSSRRDAIRRKFGVLDDVVAGKRVILVDDSIVRGNTMEPIFKLLRHHGAKEVHIRIASPPIRHPCYMGINIPCRTELIAARLDNGDDEALVDKITRHFGADSVRYLSVKGLVEAVSSGMPKDKRKGYCTACLTGEYPVEKRFDW